VKISMKYLWKTSEEKAEKLASLAVKIYMKGNAVAETGQQPKKENT
jgi:hypothetical protein